MLIIAYSRDEQFLARVLFQWDLDAKLAEMDRLLDDPKLVLRVTHGLLLSAPQPAWNGRPSTPVEVTLRICVVRRLMSWSYATAHDEIAGDAKWRWLCCIYDHPVPNHSTRRDREHLIRPTTLQGVNDRRVCLAVERGVTAGRKLRMDGTVIETNIHYPTDSRLLYDSARVLGRLLGEARHLLHPRTPTEKRLFRNRSRRAQRLARQIAHRLHGPQGKKSPKAGTKTISATPAGGRDVVGPSCSRRASPPSPAEPVRRGARGSLGAVCALGAAGDGTDHATHLSRTECESG